MLELPHKRRLCINMKWKCSRVYCATLDDLNRLILETLLTHPTVARVHSQIVMNQTKDDAPLPMADD